tara:strand:- start:95 stop:706 length:612 start_codon:yes stop_codon:yes gene_type:complete
MKKILVTQRMYKDKLTKEHRDTIDVNLSKFIIESRLLPIIVPNFLSKFSKKNFDNYLKSVKPDGLLLSGGEDFGINKFRDLTELKLLKHFTVKKLPIIGICRGMLLLSKFFGAKLGKIYGHVRTRHECITLTKDKLFPKSINSYHNFNVKNCPKNFYITVKSKDDSIEGIKHKKFNWEGWMWHPEREKKFNFNSKKRLFKIFN